MKNFLLEWIFLKIGVNVILITNLFLKQSSVFFFILKLLNIFTFSVYYLFKVLSPANTTSNLILGVIIYFFSHYMNDL